MQKYTAVAVVAVAIVVGVIVALAYNRGDIALGMVGLGSTFCVALGFSSKTRPPMNGN